MSVLPEDSRNYARPVQALPEQEQAYLLPRALLAGLHRFQSTRSIQDVALTIKDVCETEADRMETELTIVRYIAWAIPSIGFLARYAESVRRWARPIRPSVAILLALP